MKNLALLVAGEINPDLILFDPDLTIGFGQQETLASDYTLTVGSSAAICACGAARLGLRATLIGVTGNDLLGRFMRQSLKEHRVDTSHVLVDPSQKTGLSVILSRGTDRAILTHRGSMAVLRAEQVTNDLLRQNNHLHVSSFFLQTALQIGLPDLFKRAHVLGLTTSLDTNWDPSGEWNGVVEVLPWVDVFLPNENEVLALTEAAGVEEGAAHLSSLCGLVVVKLGANGGMVRHEKQTWRAPALPVKMVDTIGAGDTFNAGFLYGYLKGWPLERSLRLACACGSLSIRSAGGIQGQPSLKEAIQGMAAME